ncbi:FAD-dependent oxidoreductase [Deinococcus sp. KNUC1210]|uniref:FAD-dependent oxidoreductase n=1 Tax=Deinococcus sp. KNUC1210 TaxID=2917691 RepID=UPI00351CE351
MRIVVVGGVAAGMSAASRARRQNPDAEVVVFERGDWISYGACGLPYVIGGEVRKGSDQRDGTLHDGTDDEFSVLVARTPTRCAGRASLCG